MKKLLLLLIAATMGLSFTAQNLNAAKPGSPEPRPDQLPERPSLPLPTLPFVVVSSPGQFNMIMNLHKAVVVKFTASWCPVCRDMEVLDATMREQFKETAVCFVKVDIDNAQGLTNKYKVVGAPTYIFFKNGNEIKRKSGAIKENNYADLIKSIVKK